MFSRNMTLYNSGDSNSYEKEDKKKKSKDFLWIDGKVVKVLPGSVFIVKLENNLEITAYIAGNLKKHYIKILFGDKVNVMISRYDQNVGRICERYITQTTKMPINPKNKKNMRKPIKRKGKNRPKSRKK